MNVRNEDLFATLLDQIVNVRVDRRVDERLHQLGLLKEAH